VLWQVLMSAMDSLAAHRFVLNVGPGIGAFMVTGIWLYIMVSGVAYANLAAQRTAMMEANAARMQLDTLRSQLHPHFLFNALHTIVQLIPTNPRAATRAAEQLASALRTTIEERRDLISLGEEWDFVERYLAIESIRFGERLRVRVEMQEASRAALLPSYSLQTLVENAVRHGAAPRVEPTQITICAVLDQSVLTVQVIDNGSGADMAAIERGSGTGLRRLRERLRWLYGQRAQLELAAEPAGGFIAMLVLPQFAGQQSAMTAPGKNDDDE
jgi:LytS/YehU family sensor histidine kinase